ncbi:hypothetical protein SDC9_160063 [bioreactor metagenome]|uniref:Uncharacterized protein n=1 Tax=bioreactor metagenome TaxID=1076179 RepID=A0A645FKL0_9ZZZZ
MVNIVADIVFEQRPLVMQQYAVDRIHEGMTAGQAAQTVGVRAADEIEIGFADDSSHSEMAAGHQPLNSAGVFQRIPVVDAQFVAIAVMLAEELGIVDQHVGQLIGQKTEITLADQIVIFTFLIGKLERRMGQVDDRSPLLFFLIASEGFAGRRGAVICAGNLTVKLEFAAFHAEQHHRTDAAANRSCIQSVKDHHEKLFGLFALELRTETLLAVALALFVAVKFVGVGGNPPAGHVQPDFE